MDSANNDPDHPIEGEKEKRQDSMEDGIGGGTSKETTEADDDTLRRMMADLQDPAPESEEPEEPTSVCAIVVKEEQEPTNEEGVRVEVSTDIDPSEQLPMAQSSPSYAAAKWAATMGTGSKPIKASSLVSQSAASSRKMYHNEFLAVLQENKLKRKAAAAAAAAGASKKKKRKGIPKPRPASPKKSPGLDDSFENSSVGSSTRRSRVTEFTAEQKELLKEALRHGWKRELVYRKNQKKGSTADVYYIAPNGIRLRSLPEVDDYLRTADEKVTRDNFSFRRFVIGFDEIPGAEVVRGALDPLLAKLDQPLNSSMSSVVSTQNSAGSSPKKPKKKTIGNKSGATAKSTSSDDDQDDSDGSDGSYQPAAKQRPLLKLKSLPKASSGTSKEKAGSSSGIGNTYRTAASPKKRFAPASPASRMQKLRKLASSESQRQRNAFLKSVTANSIPVVLEPEIPLPPPTPADLKGKARKSIPPPRSVDASSHASSNRDASETSSDQEFQIPTCNDTCPVRDSKWTGVPCILCFRLFHQECLTAKGRTLSSFQFVCGECSAGQNDEDSIMADDDQAVAAPVLMDRQPTQPLVITGVQQSILASGRAVTVAIPVNNVKPIITMNTTRLNDESAIGQASTNDNASISTIRRSCDSPPLDLAVEPDGEEAPMMEILVNGKTTGELTADSGQSSPVAFPMNRFNAFVQGLASVFEQLPVRDLLNVRLVCKAWNMVSYSPSIWDYARMKGCKVHSWPQAVEFLNKRGVEKVDFTGCNTTSMNQFIETILPALSRFVVGFHFGQVLPKVLEATAIGCARNLRSLTMTLAKDPSSSSVWIPSSSFNCLTACTELVELRVSAGYPNGKSRRGFISGDGLLTLASLTKLRVLTLFDIRAIDESVFKFLDSLTALRVLEIGDCLCWTRETYSRLRRLTSLRRIRLENLEPAAAGGVLAESLQSLKELREAELVRYSFDYSYLSPSAAQPLLVLTTLPHLHTLRLYPDLDGKWPASTWRRTIDAIPHFAGMKRLELGLTMTIEEEGSEQPPAYIDVNSTFKPPFMATKPTQQQRIAYVNEEALKEWIAEKLPQTVVNVVGCLSSAELVATRAAVWW